MRKIFFILTTLCFCAFFLYQVVAFAAECKYVDKDKEKINKDGYLVSWLWLDPTIETNTTSVPAKNEDYFKDIPNKKGKKGEANLMPFEGDKVKIAVDGKEHTWMRVNFLDMVATGEIRAAVG